LGRVKPLPQISAPLTLFLKNSNDDGYFPRNTEMALRAVPDQRASVLELSMRSAADLAFHERLARELLARYGPEIVWGLHLNAMEADRDGHPRGAELLIETVDAAWRLLRESSGRELSRAPTPGVAHLDS
jgi:hypothetical protein